MDKARFERFAADPWVHTGEWDLVKWDKIKAGDLVNAKLLNIGEITDKEAVTVLLQECKRGFPSIPYETHNTDEYPIQFEGTMYWYVHGEEGRMVGQCPGEVPATLKPGEGARFPAGCPHIAWATKENPEDVIMVVFYNPPLGGPGPTPKVPERWERIKWMEHSLGQAGYMKYFDLGFCRITYFVLKAEFLPPNPKEFLINDCDKRVFQVKGRREWWIDPEGIGAILTCQPWEGLFIPRNTYYYGRVFEDIVGFEVDRYYGSASRSEPWEALDEIRENIG